MSSLLVAPSQEAALTPFCRAGTLKHTLDRRVQWAWTLLFFNTMTFMPALALIPIPPILGKGLAQASLPLAVLVALSANPRLRIRPNLFLCLATLLVVGAITSGVLPRSLGTVYRTFRLTEFIVVLWLLTPWWGRRDLLLLRCHLRCLSMVLATVFLGMLVAPGRAFAFNGRLSGVIWPVFPTQVAQYASVLAGLVIILWLGHLLPGLVTLVSVGSAIVILVLTQTRTAILGLVVGVVVAGLSLFAASSRVRRFFAGGALLITVAVLTLASVFATWLARGEDTEGLLTLTGRTNFWALVLNQPRTSLQQVFGFGLSNASVNGLQIDSNWFASYEMLGLYGVTVCVLMLLGLFVTAFFRRRGLHRALSLFLLTYCLLASITEVGFTDASPYLLHLVIAASLLPTPEPRKQVQSRAVALTT